MMKMLKLLLCALLLALPVFANEAEDRQTATSLKYVTHELDTRQDKLSVGQNKAIEYTDSAGDVTQRTVKTDLTGGTSDTSLPTVSAVTTGLNTKQNTIAPIDDHTAVTYTGQTGGISTKGIYQTSGTYAEQSDNLIDAKTFNAALKNGLDSEFVCPNGQDFRDPISGECWLWQIHSGIASYVSATGTVTQNGTPTPTNPIYPTFYQQGNMILRKVGDYADSYDATTHKITRRVGVKVFDGSENVVASSTTGIWIIPLEGAIKSTSNLIGVSTHFIGSTELNASMPNNSIKYSTFSQTPNNNAAYIKMTSYADTTEFKTFLAAQYAAGTPVTVWYPLATPVEENWSATTYGENVYLPQNQ